MTFTSWPIERGALRWARLLGPVFALANVVVVALTLWAPTFTDKLSPAAMSPEAGHNVMAAIPERAVFPYAVAWDTNSDPRASNGRVLEDGRPLGPAHALHDDIRSLGGGRFSFWAGTVYFSSSDGSDPRTNGRSYEVRYEADLSPAIVTSLLVVDLVALLVFARTMMRFAAGNVGKLAALLILAAVGRVLAAASGSMSPVFAFSGTALDAAMILSITTHLLLGACLTALIFAIGSGILLWGGRGRCPLDDLLLRAFLPGVIVMATAALLAVAIPHGWTLSLGICLAAASPLLRFRPGAAALKRIACPPLLCAPFVLWFAAIMSFSFHGPSATQSGTPIGDTTIYVGIANTLAQHVIPLFNYANEGFRLTYANLLPSLLASRLLAFGWFDPYLFFSASLPVVALLSLAMLLPILASVARAAGEPRLRLVELTVVGFLLLGMLRSPSAMVGSPPFVFLLPIVVSTIYLALVAGKPWRALAVAGLGTAVSKVIGFAVLVPLPLPDLARSLARRASHRQKLVAIAIGAVALLYVSLMLRTFLPGFIKLGLFGPSGLDYYARYHPTTAFPWFYLVMRDMGAVLLAIAVTRSSLPGLKVGAWVGAVGFLLVPFLFYTGLTAMMLATATAYVAKPLAFSNAKVLMLVSAILLLLPQTLGSEGDSLAISLAWSAVTGSVIWSVAMAGADPRTELGRPSAPWKVAAGATGLLVVVLWGGAIGAAHVGVDARQFTPDMRDIWLAVRAHTPRDSLVFTDQTGPTESRVGGWNDFALAAQRQFYVVSWEVTPLRNDTGLRERWLTRNADVISGQLRPRDLALSRAYDGYYAVIATGRTTPPNAALIYANPSYALYRLQERD